METSSNLVASMALMKPPNENSADVRNTVITTMGRLWMDSRVKASDNSVTINPIISPLAMPPTTYPARMVQLGTGDTKSSSILRWNFMEKNDDTTLESELVITAIMIKPGTMNCM